MITTATVTRQECSFLGKQSLKPGSSWALEAGHPERRHQGLGAHGSWGGWSHGSVTPSTGTRIHHRFLTPAMRPSMAAHPPLLPCPGISAPHCVCRAPATCRAASSECTHCSLETNHRPVDEPTAPPAAWCARGRRSRGWSPFEAGWQGRHLSDKSKPALPLSGDQASWAKIQEEADLVWSKNRGQGGRRGGGREAEAQSRPASIPGTQPRIFHTQNKCSPCPGPPLMLPHSVLHHQPLGIADVGADLSVE